MRIRKDRTIDSVKPDAALAEFHRHLADLGYPWWDESANPAYRMFLADRPR